MRSAVKVGEFLDTSEVESESDEGASFDGIASIAGDFCSNSPWPSVQTIFYKFGLFPRMSNVEDASAGNCVKR